VRAEFGNPGNRFVGRYFLDFDVRTGTQSGDELRAVTREGLKGMNDKRTDGEYFEQNLGWSRVTTWGLFGLGGRYLDFNFFDAPAAQRLNGGLWVGEAFWLYPILADFHSRLTTQLKVDRNSKTTEKSSNGEDTQRELYNSVEVSGSYIRTEQIGGRWDFELGLAVRKGLGEHTAGNLTGVLPATPQTNANLDYLLYRPAVRLKYYFADDVTLGLDATAQITSDTVPEQQQWVMGGLNNLAYALPGIAIGDSGYLGRLVLEAGQYDIAGMQFTPKAFAEYGQTRFENVAGNSKPTLGDGGVELAVKVLSWLDASAAYAAKFTDKDFTQAELDDAKANLYFRVQAKF
jgi:hemolysin activation/secretion protein